MRCWLWLLTVFRLVPTYEMLMNVYIASWVFTGVALFIVYFRYMKKVEKKFALRTCSENASEGR